MKSYVRIRGSKPRHCSWKRVQLSWNCYSLISEVINGIINYKLPEIFTDCALCIWQRMIKKENFLQQQLAQTCQCWLVGKKMSGSAQFHHQATDFPGTLKIGKQTNINLSIQTYTERQFCFLFKISQASPYMRLHIQNHFGCCTQKFSEAEAQFWQKSCCK